MSNESQDPTGGTPTLASPSFPTAPAVERRRSGWSEFRHHYPGLLATMTVALVVLLAIDGWIFAKRRRYNAEIERLRASMTALERQRTDHIVSSEQNKLRIALALLRRQAQVEKMLHLSVTIDSSAMYLEREGALLRAMPVEIGPERRVGIAPDTVRLAAPRGMRTVARVLTGADTWEVPAWVYVDRGLAVPAARAVRGALGPAAFLLDGGTVVYSLPSAGPLSDSNYVLPGAVRARAEDLLAILPNLSSGVRVFFY
jgi:hypothetical protein